MTFDCEVVAGVNDVPFYVEVKSRFGEGFTVFHDNVLFDVREPNHAGWREVYALNTYLGLVKTGQPVRVLIQMLEDYIETRLEDGLECRSKYHWRPAWGRQTTDTSTLFYFSVLRDGKCYECKVTEEDLMADLAEKAVYKQRAPLAGFSRFTNA